MSLAAETNVEELIKEMGVRARAASRALATLAPAVKNSALEAIASAFERHRAEIRAENAKDVAGAEEHGLSKAAVDRLRLDDKRVNAMAAALREVIALPDPVGELVDVRVRPNGLRVGHMRSPIGVIGIIYESRPNVTADAGALCLKSGNAVILRGGSEAFHSNTILAKLMNHAATEAGVPDGAIQLIPTRDREAVGALLKASQYVDVIIPRGGKPLIERVTKESEIPVIKHLDGNCTVYVDETANLDDALRIIINSKVQRPGVCNAAETMLVHRAVADKFLAKAGKELQARGVEIRGDKETMRLVPGAVAAAEQDWYDEYLDLILAVKVVDSYEEAVDFINHYGSHHTEAIVTNDHKRAMHFLSAVDSACVHVNASTRFSDGGEYGLGAEIGISTNKLHARGPMGLVELTTAKWVVFGEGQIRE